MNNILNNKITLIKVLVFLFLFVLLMLSFNRNAFNVVSQHDFLTWQNDSESLVLGRVLRSREVGLAADYGVLQRDINWRTENKFITGNDVEEFSIYLHQVGLQGFVFGVLDRIFPLNNDNMLSLFYFLNAMFLSIMLSLIAFWAIKNFNYLSGVGILIGSIFSHGLVMSARNMYWVVWTMLLPFVLILYLHWFEERKRNISHIVFMVAAFCSAFIRLGNGFEFTSTILLTLLMPIFFYGIKNCWSKKKVIIRTFFIGLGGFLAFVSTFVINIWQRSMYLGALSYGWASMRRNIGLRTSRSFPFNVVDDRQLIQDSLDASVLYVINRYVRGSNSLFFDFQMGELILLLVIFTVCMVLSGKLLNSIYEKKNQFISLAVMTFFSMLAPISWFALGKGHSYIHAGINYILWYIPSVLLVFALAGATIHCICKELWKYCNNTLKRSALICGLIIVFSWPAVRTYEMWEWNENVKAISEISREGERVFSDGDINIYYFQNTLMYSVKKDSEAILPWFGVQVVPKNLDDLAEEWRHKEFEPLDFNLRETYINVPFWKRNIYGIIALPSYDIERILTGQPEVWIYEIEMSNIRVQ